MPWKISWSNEAASELSKLDNAAVSRIVLKLERALKNPMRFFERLAGSDYYKLRIGDYRILALIFHSDEIISVQKLGHRKNVYR